MMEGLEQKRLLPKQPGRHPRRHRSRLSAAKAAVPSQSPTNFRIWTTLCMGPDIVKRSGGRSIRMMAVEHITAGP